MDNAAENSVTDTYAEKKLPYTHTLSNFELEEHEFYDKLSFQVDIKSNLSVGQSVRVNADTVIVFHTGKDYGAMGIGL